MDLMEILISESPFFIEDICVKYDLKPKTVWNYINYRKRIDKFKSKPVKRNKNGRYPLQYEVIQDAVQSK